jgi:tetratricopeptide (TPR) repeat protein
VSAEETSVLVANVKGTVSKSPVHIVIIGLVMVTLGAMSGGCAAAKLQRAEQLALLRADELVLQGCHACLTEARELYQQAFTRRRSPALVQRLFEADLLIGLREKELALDWTASFVRARGLAADLPPAFDADRYLRLAEAVLPDDIGTPRHERNALLATQILRAEQLKEELSWLETGALGSAVRRYLALALECSYGEMSRSRQSPAGLPAPEPQADLPGLLLYRTAVCRPTAAEWLDRLRSEVPRFAEAALVQGRVALRTVQQDGGSKAREFLQEAYSAFPLSPAVTYMNGSLNQLAGDCRTALRFYDETLARKSSHEDALLGRAACLSVLKEPDAAIAVATRLIDMRAYNQADAFYWRAWNHHQRAELSLARADANRAKTLQYNSPVLTLAGMIEHDQGDLSPAETDLAVAKDLDSSNCTARWYLALVALKREVWAQAGSRFASAMECYTSNAADAERRMQAMAVREDVDPQWRATQLAGFEAAIREDRSQESASAYNAAVNFLRAGDRANAVTHADLAARDPQRRPKVEELRTLLTQSRP